MKTVRGVAIGCIGRRCEVRCEPIAWCAEAAITGRDENASGPDRGGGGYSGCWAVSHCGVMGVEDGGGVAGAMRMSAGGIQVPSITEGLGE